MNFAALLAEAAPVPFHALLAIAALIAGAIQLSAPKGTLLHRSLGYFWAALMAIVAVTGLFISEIGSWGYFSPVHLLVPVVLGNLWWALHSARRGDIRRHKIIMICLFFLGLALTGALTLLPDRAMHQVFFG